MAATTARTAIHPLVEKGKVLRTKGAALGGLPAPSVSTRSRDGEQARDVASRTGCGTGTEWTKRNSGTSRKCDQHPGRGSVSLATCRPASVPRSTADASIRARETACPQSPQGAGRRHRNRAWLPRGQFSSDCIRAKQPAVPVCEDSPHRAPAHPARAPCLVPDADQSGLSTRPRRPHGPSRQVPSIHTTPSRARSSL